MKLLEAGGARCRRRGVELFSLGGGCGEAGSGEAERNRGRAGGRALAADRLAGGMLRAENASDNEPKIGLARDVLPTGTCCFVCNAAEGIPRGNIQGGRDPALLGGTRTGCSITARSHMFP